MKLASVVYDGNMIAKKRVDRAFVACNACRASKLKCHNQNDRSRCQRCESLNLECTYILKESQLKRKKISKSLLECSVERSVSPRRVAPEKKRSIMTMSSQPYAILPPKSYVVETVEIFFDSQYHGIFPFLHRPSFYAFIRSPDFDPDNYIQQYYSDPNHSYVESLVKPDPVVLLGILALCARLHPVLPQFYANFTEDDSPELFRPNFDSKGPPLEGDGPSASNYFGWHARSLLKEAFDSPTIQRAQALVLLSSHEWGEGNASRSYLYVGIASRMALVLGLGNENRLHDDVELDTLDESQRYIAVEAKRRTIWSVYMMDKCNGSGRNRASCIRMQDVGVRLPCEEKEFFFGAATKKRPPSYVEAQALIESGHKLELSCFAFQIILFETWNKITRWVSDTDKHDKQRPWLVTSSFTALTAELDRFLNSLPSNLVYNRFNLEAHVADGSGANFGYFHGLYYLSRIFLTREYSLYNPEIFPKGWWSNVAHQFLSSVENLAGLLKCLKDRGVLIIAPFTGFQTYTVSASALCFKYFPETILCRHYTEVMADESKLKELKSRFEDIATRHYLLLKTWKHFWSLGNSWTEILVRLKKMFKNANIEIVSTAAQSKDDYRYTLRDYGNGKIEEVYVPTQRNQSMKISNLLVAEKSNAGSPESKTNTVGVESGFEKPRSIFQAADLESPMLDVMNNLDFSTFLPNWSEITKL